MDPVQLIERDHQTIERLFKRMEHALASEDPRAAAAALRDVIRELSIHAAIEEQFLYPAMRRAAPPEEVLYAVEEHHAVKVTLTELQATPPADPRFGTKARLLIENVRRHVEEEERELLPRLEKTLTPDQQRELGIALSNAKLLSPTRPHPGAPETPPGNLLVGPAFGLVDHLRDALRDGVFAVRDALQGALETAMILMRRVSSEAERRGREAVEDVAARTRMATEEVRDAGRRTLEDARGRGSEAARQLRAPARRAARKASRIGRAARRAANAR